MESFFLIYQGAEMYNTSRLMVFCEWFKRTNPELNEMMPNPEEEFKEESKEEYKESSIL